MDEEQSVLSEFGYYDHILEVVIKVWMGKKSFNISIAGRDLEFDRVTGKCIGSGCCGNSPVFGRAKKYYESIAPEDGKPAKTIHDVENE